MGRAKREGSLLYIGALENYNKEIVSRDFSYQKMVQKLVATIFGCGRIVSLFNFMSTFKLKYLY
jgi:hypothetical protein